MSNRESIETRNRKRVPLAPLLWFVMAWLSLMSQGVAAETRDEVVYFLNDALGSAIAAVNEDGDLCWSERYTPYGDKLINDDTVQIQAGCGLLGEERGFTGHTEDYSTDLVYMQQRYYDPSMGRFLSVDPVGPIPGDSRTFNRYAYGANNPYTYVDRTGEIFETPWDLANVGMGLVSFAANVGTGNFAGAAVDLVGIAADVVATMLPGAPAVAGTTIKTVRTAEVVADSAKVVAQGGKNFAGNQSRNQRLKDLVNNDKVSSADKGWIRQEMNEVSAGKKGHLRNPPGKDLAHERGRENAKGYGYEHSHLQNRKDHRSQHKLDSWGRNNKERPVR